MWYVLQSTATAFVRLSYHQVLFFKTRLPIEPVSFVHRICLDAFNSVGSKKTRFVKRFTPMTRMGKATEKGIDEVSRAVLAPVFHLEGAPSKKVPDFFPCHIYF